MVVPEFATFVAGLPITHRAVEFAAERHRGQRRPRVTEAQALQRP